MATLVRELANCASNLCDCFVDAMMGERNINTNSIMGTNNEEKSDLGCYREGKSDDSFSSERHKTTGLQSWTDWNVVRGLSQSGQL